MENIILILISVVSGFVLCLIVMNIIKKRWDKDCVATLIMVLQEQFDLSKEVGFDSGVHYILERKGLDYAIYYFGKVYTILHSVKNKDESMENIEKSLSAFLSGALAKDIEEYKEKMKDRKSRKEALIDAALKNKK